MAIELPKTIFSHVPKTAGRTIRHALVQAFPSAEGVGEDPFHHGAHFPILKTTEEQRDFYTLCQEKALFAFVRRPEDWLRSLFYQRQRKGWNWQSNAWEQDTKSEDLNQFAENWLSQRNYVWSYMEYHATMGYSGLSFTPLRKEYMVSDLLRFLDQHGETYDQEPIMRMNNWVVGTAAGSDWPRIDNNIALAICENEPKLMEMYGD